jgi:hypothetical protein
MPSEIRTSSRPCSADAPLSTGHLLLVFGWAVRKAHSHAAQSEGRNFQIARSQFALLHNVSFGPFNLTLAVELSRVGAYKILCGKPSDRCHYLVDTSDGLKTCSQSKSAEEEK